MKHIILIEDNEADALLIEEALATSGLICEVTRTVLTGRLQKRAWRGNTFEFKRLEVYGRLYRIISLASDVLGFLVVSQSDELRVPQVIDVGQKECARITERGSFAFSSSQGKVPRSTTGRLQ